MSIKRLIILTAVALCVSSVSFAQSKSETKLYNSSIKKGTVKAYNKFLSKYPDSNYSIDISHKRDSLLILSLDGTLLSYLQFMNGYPSSDLYGEIEDEMVKRVMSERYVQNDQLSNYTINAPLTKLAIEGISYLFFTYTNYQTEENLEREFVATLVNNSTGALFFAMFSGKLLFDKPSGKTLIEGVSMDKESNISFPTPEMTYLLKYLDDNETLLPISEADLMTDQAVEWWYKQNSPGSKMLDFGLLPVESSIVSSYLAEKAVKGSSYNAAILQIRGNTLICVYQKSSRQYILVWCEPQCKNKKIDKDLNSIYFESANSLVLYYYKGNRTFKERINLATKRKS